MDFRKMTDEQIGYEFGILGDGMAWAIGWAVENAHKFKFVEYTTQILSGFVHKNCCAAVFELEDGRRFKTIEFLMANGYYVRQKSYRPAGTPIAPIPKRFMDRLQLGRGIHCANPTVSLNGTWD